MRQVRREASPDVVFSSNKAYFIVQCYTMLQFVVVEIFVHSESIWKKIVVQFCK